MCGLAVIANPIVSYLIKVQNGFTVLVQVYTGCVGKDAVKWVIYVVALTTTVAMAVCQVNPGLFGLHSILFIHLFFQEITSGYIKFLQAKCQMLFFSRRH